jgi:Cu-processing system permease protein
MMDFTTINTIARKELRENLRNRWFIIYMVAFTGLALALAALGQPGGAQAAGYSRTAASLVNLVLLFVPLIGLTLGAANIAGDRETGTLIYLLAQPVTGAEVLLGKYLGMAGALFASLSLGFGLAGVAMIGHDQAISYMVMVILACLLGLAMLSLGFLVSVTARKTSTALGGSLGLWLLLVFVGDLGVMGTAIVMQLPISTVFMAAALNPLQLFKFVAILSIQANLEILGPAGMYATQQFGAALLPLMLIGLALWIVLPLAGAVAFFERQGSGSSRSSQGAV